MSEKYKRIPATYLKPYPLKIGSGAMGLRFKYDNGEIHELIGNTRMIVRIINNIKPNQKVIINYAEEWDWYLELMWRNDSKKYEIE